MATLRHHQRRIAVYPPIARRRSPGGEASHAFGRLVDAFDRPLRFAAGDDLALLRIFRGTAIGTLFAAIGAAVLGALA